MANKNKFKDLKKLLQEQKERKKDFYRNHGHHVVPNGVYLYIESLERAINFALNEIKRLENLPPE